MKMENMKTLTLALPLALLVGCATTDYNSRPYNYGSDYNYSYSPSDSYHNHYGTVIGVRYIEDEGIGAGAVVGSVIGGLIGNQIGSGTGRTAATVGGVIAGGVIGHKIQENRADLKQVVDIRLDGGEVVSIVQDDNVRFYSGQRVKIWGTGSNLRLITEGQYNY